MFKGTTSAHPWGIAAVAAGAGLCVAGWFAGGEADGRASLTTLGGLLFFYGAYLVLYGKNGSRRAFFPLASSFFSPCPSRPLVMEKIIAVLVVGSAYMTRLLFMVFRVPFVQDGPLFYLPGLVIEVAPQCSGIRSSLALLVTALLAGHLFLARFRNKALLALAVLPVALFKNAMRITILYLLSYFVDMRIILGGFLHRSGGFIFFGLGLFVLGSILWLLRQGESRNPWPKAAHGPSNDKKINQIESGG